VGTGLGLALDYGIVAELEAVIDVRSTVGKGALSSSISRAPAMLPRSGRARSRKYRRRRCQRVLVVDDEEML